MSCLLRTLLAVLLLLLPLGGAPAAAYPVDRAIDDELGDSATGLKLIYSPPDAWVQGTATSGSIGTEHAFEGTLYHASMNDLPDHKHRTTTAALTGSALHVFYILANTQPATADHSATLTFPDKNHVGSFIRIPYDSTSTTQHDVLVHGNGDFANAPHTIRIESPNSLSSRLIFDQI
ncbi:hypothetical protein OH77DRAFT_1409699, partial [Trametes cingulata]